jgi:hypothetical protein
VKEQLRRGEARMKMLQRKTRPTVEEYFSKQKIVKTVCRRKKRIKERQTG